MTHSCDMKMFGSVTVGSRGQVVIPKEVRDILSIKEGDQLMVVTKYGKAIGLLKTNDIQEFIQNIEAEMRA